LSPLLYSLNTYSMTAAEINTVSNTIVKLADDTTVIGLIEGGDETA